MKLKEWRISKGLSLKEVAEMISAKKEGRPVNEATVYRWETGESVPQRRNLAIVYEISGGMVTAHDFFSEAA